MTYRFTLEPNDTFTIRPWPDAVLDRLGHDLRSEYVERFWLPILGPTSVCLLRRLGAMFEEWPDGFEIDVDLIASSLGLTPTRSPHGQLMRTIARCCQFGMARSIGRHELVVHRTVAPVTQQRLRRLPVELRRDHATFVAHVEALRGG